VTFPLVGTVLVWVVVDVLVVVGVVVEVVELVDDEVEVDVELDVVEVDVDVDVDVDPVLLVELEVLLVELEPWSAEAGFDAGPPAAIAAVRPRSSRAAKATAARIRLKMNLPLSEPHSARGPGAVRRL
jgi:hypothetical protein